MCKKYCTADIPGAATHQVTLLNTKLNNLSRETLNKIHEWEWLLRSSAEQEHADSYARLARQGKGD